MPDYSLRTWTSDGVHLWRASTGTWNYYTKFWVRLQQKDKYSEYRTKQKSSNCHSCFVIRESKKGGIRGQGRQPKQDICFSHFIEQAKLFKRWFGRQKLLHMVGPKTLGVMARVKTRWTGCLIRITWLDLPWNNLLILHDKTKAVLWKWMVLIMLHTTSLALGKVSDLPNSLPP